MTGKLKRYISLDVLRGLSIIGVFSMHLLNESYDYRAVLDGNPGIFFYIFLIPLGFLAEFVVLFICLSAVSNTISMDRKWDRIMSEWDRTPREGRKHAFRTLLKTQLVRGLFIAFLAYIAEVFLNHMLLHTILGSGDAFNEGMEELFRAQILWLIGIGLIITSLVYLLMKRADWSKKKMILTLIIIALCTLFIVTPFLQWLYATLGFPRNAYVDWTTTNWGTNILRIFLAPIVNDDFPLFPYVAAMFIGVIIGFLISKEQVEKKHLNWFFFSSVILFVVGVLFYYAEGALETTLTSLSIRVDAGIYMMSTAGAILAILIFLYLIDIRRGRKQVKFFFFQRFGIMSLSLWMFQWVMAFPIMLLQFILNLINFGSDLGSFIPTRLGPFFNLGLGGYGIIGVIIYIIVFWSLILWLWQKVNFVGSFEWMTVKLMSGKHGHERAKISDAIINTESLSDPPQKYYKWYMVALFFFVFLMYCVLFAVITLL